MYGSGRRWPELDLNGAALVETQVIAVGNQSVRGNRRARASDNSEISCVRRFDRNDINEILRRNYVKSSRAPKRDRLARAASSYGIVPEIQARCAHGDFRRERQSLGGRAAGTEQPQ
jgi:hypothetical protein